MESHFDLAFYGDAILTSDDDEPEDAPQATLKLLGDFPEPLTEPQRRAVLRYVSQQVHEFELVRRQVAVVELGYLALLRLVKRLRKEQAKLQASLDDEGETKMKTPTTATEATNADSAAAAAPVADVTSSTATVPQTQDAKGSSKSAAAPAATAAAATTGTAASKESAAGPKRRPGGLLLRSSVFSGMQRVLQAAKTEQHDAKAEQLAKQRERIAKESRLHLVSQDLASQEALLEPLRRKYHWGVALAQEAADQAGPLLTLLEDMWRLEALYPARFSMHAAGHLEPLMWSPGGGEGAGVGDGNEEAEAEKVEGAEALRPTSAACAVTSAAVAFVVPFAPAQYSSEVEDLIRAQVEDIIDEYLAYRGRIDPVLYQLEQEQQAAKAKKVDQLMDLIGVKGAEAGAEMLAMGGTAIGVGRPSHVSAAELTGKSAQTMLHISSSDDDEDRVESGVGGVDAADKDRQDREQIRTALTALDDFEDA